MMLLVEVRARVSGKLKMGKSSKMERIHPKVAASSAGTLRRCVKHIAEGGRSERHPRDERSWPFGPGDCPGAGRVPRHGAPVPESPEAMRPRPRPPRGSKLDPCAEHIDRRMAGGLENCRVLDREVRALDQGGYSTVVQYVRPRRRHKQPEAAMRFGTAPGEQAQVDWGSLPHIGEDGKRRRVRVFVMTMGWSRACCVELVRRADTAAFIQCRVNAFEYLGGVSRRCLYDNAKVITLGRDEEKRPVWNRRMLDFALRAGFEARLCQLYRAQTKGKVESGVKYVRRNMWPSMRFTDDADLNRQGLEWSGVVANARVHGTTYRIPWEMPDEERACFGKLPDRVTLAPYLREDRKGRTGRWPGTASSAGRTPAAGSTGNGWEGRCRWDSGWARWRSGQAMSASRCIPGPSGRGSASFSPAPRPVARPAQGG